MTDGQTPHFHRRTYENELAPRNNSPIHQRPCVICSNVLPNSELIETLPASYRHFSLSKIILIFNMSEIIEDTNSDHNFKSMLDSLHKPSTHRDSELLVYVTIYIYIDIYIYIYIYECVYVCVETTHIVSTKRKLFTEVLIHYCFLL